MTRSQLVRRTIAWLMVALLVVSTATWWLTRDTLPRTIRIATARPGGQYHLLGEALARNLEERTGRRVELVTSDGSVANVGLLRRGEVDLALVQAGAAPLARLAVLAPLHHDVIHVVARQGRGIADMRDLVGKRVAIGPRGSGMHVSALQLLAHYRLTLEELDATEQYFAALLEDPTLDAAIATTGILNQDLGRVLSSGGLELIPVLDAEAIALRTPFYRAFSIPRGLYAERPPVPAEAKPTVATTALLVTNPDSSARLIEEALAALHQPETFEAFPTLISQARAAEWSSTPLHPVARRVFDPYGDLGVLASFMESLAAAKELLFALVAVAYLAWSRWSRLREKERAAELSEAKERLDALLDRTVGIEREQMRVTDPARLERYLDEITEIKLRALTELSNEDLRSDRTFLIFLTQCANLIQKLQGKLQRYG